MQGRKIYRLWSSLSEQERKSFLQERKGKLPGNLQSYFNALKKRWAGGIEGLDQRIWKLLFRGSAFNKSRFNHICNRALQALLEYIKETRMDREVTGYLYPELLLLREFAERDLENIFASQVKHIKKTAEQKGKQGKSHFDSLFELSWQEYDYYNGHVARGRYPAEETKQLHAFNDLRYLYHLARTNASILNRNQILRPPMPLHRIELMRTLAEEMDLDAFPGVEVLIRYIEIVFRGSDPEDLEDFTRYYLKVQPQLDEGDRFLMYGFLLNSYIQKLNSGEQSLYRNLMLLLLRGIRTGDLFLDGTINPGHFKNFVVIANMLKRYALAEWFIETYKDRIGREANQERAKLLIAYCKADLHFSRQEFEEAGHVLSQALLLPKFQDSYHNLSHRILQIKVYIESEAFEQASSALRALRMYIHNSQALEESTEQIVRTHVNYLYKVWNLYANNAGDAKELHKKLKGENPFRGMAWIAEKLQARMK